MPAHLIAEEGPLIGLVLNLEEQDSWILGRDPDQADFILEDTTVSRKHVQISVKEDGVYLRNLSKVNPTLINDQEVPKIILLKEGDRVRIGQNVFLFSEESIPLQEQTPPKKEVPKEEPIGGFDAIFDDITPEEIKKEPEKTSKKVAKKKKEPSAYDTIFEDSDEQLPFPLISDTPFLLKVISGPNAGAEIGMEKNRVYSIGKDPNSSDIVFQDLSVSRNHARVSIDESGKIFVEDLNSKNKTKVNGFSIEEKKEISSEDLVSVGTTVFLILDRSKPQETIYSPAFTQYEEEEPEEETVKKLPSDWKTRAIPTKYLISAGSIAAIFLFVFLSFFSLFKPERVDIAQKNPEKVIEKTIQQFSDIQYSFNPATGKLFVLGHVLTPTDHQQLLYHLNALPFVASIEDHVIIDEYIWRNVNDVLVENTEWRGINLYAQKAGHFIISGYLETTEQDDLLKDYLNTHFPYLDRLENQVYVEQNLALQAQGLLLAQGFDGVALQVNNGNLMLTGNFNEKKQREYEHLVKDIEAINGIRSVQNFAVAASEASARIDLTQNYQVTGYASFDSENYSIVVNGRIVTLGEYLDGMEVTRIQPETILLERDGLKYKIDYTR